MDKRPVSEQLRARFLKYRKDARRLEKSAWRSVDEMLRDMVEKLGRGVIELENNATRTARAFAEHPGRCPMCGQDTTRET